MPLQAIPPLPPRAVSEESVNGPLFQVVEPTVPFFRHQSVVHDREYLLAQIGQMSVIETQLAAERDRLRAQLIEVRMRLSVVEMLTATRIHGMREQPGGPRPENWEDLALYQQREVSETHQAAELRE